MLSFCSNKYTQGIIYDTFSCKRRKKNCAASHDIYFAIFKKLNFIFGWSKIWVFSTLKKEKKYKLLFQKFHLLYSWPRHRLYCCRCFCQNFANKTCTQYECVHEWACALTICPHIHKTQFECKPNWSMFAVCSHSVQHIIQSRVKFE